MSQFNINNCPTSVTNQPAANGSSEIVSPSCDEYQNGLTCESRNFIGKLNWFFNRITTCLFDLTARVETLENEVKLVDIQFIGDTQIIEVYSNGTTEVNDVSVYTNDVDTDTRLTNPRVGDPDNDGNPNITWDVIDENGNVIGVEVYEVTGNGNGGSNPVDLCLVPTATQAELDAANEVSYLTCVDGNLRRAFGLPKTCVATNVQNTQATGSTFSRGDFTFADVSSSEVASTAGALDLTLTVVNPDLELLSLSANRFRITVSANNSSGTLTFTFERVICNLVLNLFDVDNPVETFTNWSKAPDSVSPAFGNEVDSKVTFTNINSNTLTVTYSSQAEATTGYIDSVTECAPCEPGFRCTDSQNNVTLEDTNGNTLTNYIEC